MNKKVSVIIPTYKRSDFLQRAIDSVLNQTYSNIEIIVIDDNEPNSKFRKRTQRIMLQYSEQPNVGYITNPKNMGGALTRNVGINASTGEYITFLDDDDEYMPNKVKEQLNFMLSTNCDMSFTDLRLVNKNKRTIDYREYRRLTSFDKVTLLKYHLMRHITGTPTFMYKSNAIKEIGGFDNVKVGQEFHLMLKSIERGLHIAYLSKCQTIAYRYQGEGISQGTTKIIGEKELYKFKHKYFNILSIREKMFVRFRHYAVMAVAYKRDYKLMSCFLSVIKMFVSSPIDTLIEIFHFLFNILKSTRTEG